MVLYVQLYLAVWQIVRLTPLALLVKAFFLWLQTKAFKVLGGIQLDTGYCIPNIRYRGLIFLEGALKPENYDKEHMATLIALDEKTRDIEPEVPDSPPPYSRHNADGSSFMDINTTWHGHTCDFRLERTVANPNDSSTAENLFLTATIDKKTPVKYYIDDEEYWWRVITVFNHNNFVIVKDKKTFLGIVKSGHVLDPLQIIEEILLNHKFLNSDRGWLLPVRYPYEETKILAGLTVLGLYGQVKGFSQIALLVLTIATIVLQFSSRVRKFIYQRVNVAAAWCVQSLVDRLSLSNRRFIYTFGTYWEDVVPCNDCEARVISTQPSFTQRCKKTIGAYFHPNPINEDRLELQDAGTSSRMANHEEEEEEEEEGTIRFFSVGNVKCNDLTFVRRIVPKDEFPSDIERGTDTEGTQFWGKTEMEDVIINIKWGHHLSLRQGVQQKLMSHARALVHCYDEYKSGAIYSKEGSHVKVWGIGPTLYKLLLAPISPTMNVWKAKHVTIR